ncbi:MAG: 2-oxo acid dehydrogenase subunit E2 [Spirochaetia bacterium]|nr:2-oxo acid dehydrogenase subunit E2 [Spirochaetia bacterium]
MATEIVFSQSGESGTRAIIHDWLVHEMEIIQEGQVLCRVMVDETIHEVKAPCEGLLLKMFIKEKEHFEIPAIIGVVGLEPSSIADLQPVKSFPDRQDRIIKIKGVRKIIAERMHKSLQTTAQLTMHATADARGLLAFRKQCKDAADSEMRSISINDMLLWIVSRVLERFPGMNALMLEESIIEKARVNLGFAVDTPRGLMVPVIKDARFLTMRELSVQTKKLAQLCIQGKFPPEILEGGTFTVTNLGMFGINGFTPILNTPQVAILGIDSIELKPIVVSSDIQFIPHIGLSLTVDHRVVDGAPGARFLSSMVEMIAGFPYELDGKTKEEDQT